jgi:diguanylate cyclase (GGDEF)-like protein/PAS domain S-box-containing protein
MPAPRPEPSPLPPAPSPAPGRLSLAQRLHARLMADYNRKATVYWWSMVLLGLVACGQSLLQLAALPLLSLLQLAGGLLLAMLMALFPLKIPRTNQVFSIGDVFIFLLLLTHGAAAACLAAGLEALVSSWRSSKRWTTRLGSAAIAAVTMWVCGQLLQVVMPGLATSSADHAAALVLATMAFGLLYSACNALLMSAVARLKRNEPIDLSAFVSVFGWVGGASTGAAAIAALLFITARLAGLAVMLTIVPTLGLLLSTLHFFARQQASEHAVQQAAAVALERDAALAASQAREREAELAAQYLRDLETSERRFQSAFTQASIGMALVSLDGQIHLANPALRGLLGDKAVDLTGQRFGDYVASNDLKRLHGTLAEVARGSADTLPVELCCQRHDGGQVWASISCSLFSEPDSDGPSLIMQIQDISARRHAEVELQHRAFHDKLTGLPNRERFHETLRLAITRADSGPGRAFAVMFLDFDRFKLINDSKGHTVGDEFLVQASARLARTLRSGDVLARLGGDEFAILAAGLARDSDAVELAERLLVALREPLQLGSMAVTASASIGITFSSIGYTRPEDMLRDADIAMYRAKNEGKARYALFDVQLHTEVANRVRLEAELRLALPQQALSVAYQPLVDLRTGHLKGFEALSRWTHPVLGPVSPAAFIPIAEESGLITQLTDGVVQRACAQLRDWQRAFPAFANLHVHVNASARDVADPEFVLRVRQALQACGLAPRHLVIELTENILMAQLSAAIGTLHALRELGVGLSVDDFGTGYSSLSHLSVLPIDSLKIDMSFVRHLRAGSKEAAVIRAIVLLGTSLGKQVIAEGVETLAQMELLRDLGCDLGQGYYMARPLPADGITQLLQGQQIRPGLPAPPSATASAAAVSAPVALLPAPAPAPTPAPTPATATALH